jgi:xyloglucan fucosyltransferase
MKGHDDCNYLIMVDGAFGLGNHFLSLISAFTYALATDRVFLIDSRSLFAKLLCDPFPGSSWLLPVDFPYEEVATAPAFIHAIGSEFRDVDLLCLHLEHIQVNCKIMRSKELDLLFQ